MTERTVRRDIDRLRELGYRIESTPGVAGGYRLEAGSALPPLLLDDDEAVAIAVGLRVAAAQRLLTDAETPITALAKLEQVLPAPLRQRVNALATAVQPAVMRTGAPVTTEILGELAIACRDGERLRLQYTASDGTQTRRRIDPHAITPAERNWYLLAWDHDRDDWRTFRVDRIDQIEHTRVLFTRQDISPEEIEDRARVAASWAPQRIEGHAVMELSYEDMRAWFGPWGDGSEPEGASHTRWPIGGSDFRDVMYGLSWIPAGTDYVLDLPDAALAEIRETVARLQRALEQSVGSSA